MEQIVSPTNTKQSKPLRIRWIDYAKGIGIFLVVVGHTIRGLVNSSILKSSTAVSAVDHWIYGFHMPLFFFLAGLFIERSISKSLKVFLVDKLRVIAYPYVLWSLLQSILQIATSRYTNNALSFPDIWRIIYAPVMQFWFLYTLFVIMLVYAIARKQHISPLVFVIITTLFYYLQGQIGLGPWGVLYLVRMYALYLALGALVGSSGVLSKLGSLKRPILVAVIIGGFLAVGLAVKFNLTEQVYLKPIVAVFGIAASVALAILLEKLDVTDFIEQWGRLSLQIYVAHSIASSILRIGLYKVFGFSEPLTHLILGTAIGIYAPIALEMLCQKIRFRYMFTLPSARRDKPSQQLPNPG